MKWRTPKKFRRRMFPKVGKGKKFPWVRLGFALQVQVFPDGNELIQKLEALVREVVGLLVVFYRWDYEALSFERSDVRLHNSPRKIRLVHDVGRLFCTGADGLQDIAECLHARPSAYLDCCTLSRLLRLLLCIQIFL